MPWLQAESTNGFRHLILVQDKQTRTKFFLKDYQILFITSLSASSHTTYKLGCFLFIHWYNWYNYVSGDLADYSTRNVWQVTVRMGTAWWCCLSADTMSYAVFSPSPVPTSQLFWHYSAPPTYSWLNSTQVFCPLLLFKLRLSFHLSFYCSLTFPSTPFCSSFWPPPVLFFDHSLYLAYLLIIPHLCMWIFVACEFFVPCYFLHSSPLNVACC